MASAELHIKDSFYFEVPKLLWPSKRESIAQFPDVWVKNDPHFQAWEADRQCDALIKAAVGKGVDVPPKATLLADYEHWLHADHVNFGKPFDIFLEEHAGEWYSELAKDAAWKASWQTTAASLGDVREYVASGAKWDAAKIDAYNYHLSGKVVIPQPFGQLRNLYQGESGFCISKFMVIEAAVFLILLVVFARIGKRVASGAAPQGRFWNFFESMLVFVRDEIARKAIQSHAHHDDDHAGSHSDDAHGHEHKAHGDKAHGDKAHGDKAHGDKAHAGGHHAAADANPHADADAFVPLLWTVFFFILGCNLMGMLPWLGAPTSSWGATIAMASITFLTGMLSGSKRFGFFGYWANQVPSMGLPFVLAIVLVPAIFFIEVLGLVIKHTVLSVRLLANMIAGHLVLLAILMLAFSVEGAASSSWTPTAIAASVGSALLSCLELFVAFLQAYVFTLLSALFINAAIHKH
jgi:F-type H+-transporting ATPase subunit a